MDQINGTKKVPVWLDVDTGNDVRLRLPIEMPD
jgi:hypothetical protein